VHVDHWDVGQGDCSVIHLDNGNLIVIDVGDENSPLVDWFNIRPARIEAIILTHNDRDHVGALASLLEIKTLTIDAVFLIQDDSWRDERIKRLYNCLVKHQGKVRTSLITDPKNIYSYAGTSIDVVHPNSLKLLGASGHNQKSVIVKLSHIGEVCFVWPGDARISTVHEIFRDRSIMNMKGPHHGAPEDRKSKDFATQVNELSCQSAYVSVGSNAQSRYGHPDKNYLKLLLSNNCRIRCSQITQLCDSNRERPVLDGSSILGLVPCRSGTACRGSMRYTLVNGKFTPDHLDQEHLDRVHRLKRPVCLSKS